MDADLRHNAEAHNGAPLQARLEEELRKRSLDTEGTKPDLIERLHGALTAPEQVGHALRCCTPHSFHCSRGNAVCMSPS